MALPDKHDPRRFTHFAQLADDGSVAAIVEVAEGSPEPSGRFVHFDVTDQVPKDTKDILIPAHIAAKVAANTDAVQRADAQRQLDDAATKAAQAIKDQQAQQAAASAIAASSVIAAAIQP